MSQQTIHQTQERLDLCLSAGNLAWWEMELPSGKVVFNENKVKMLGYSPEDFQNPTFQDFMDLVHPDDYNKTMKAMKDHLEGKKEFYETEYRIKTKNGLYKWYYDRGSIINRNKKKDIMIVKGIVIDISQIKQSENLEKLSNQVLNLLNKSGNRVNEIKDILMLLKQYTDFEAIGIRIKKGNTYPYYETNGFPANFIKKANSICKNNSIERTDKKQSIIKYECMCGTVISGQSNPNYPFFTSNGSFWTNNLEELLEENPYNIRTYYTRKTCIYSGYNSIALIPIKTDNKIIGLVQINDKRKDMLNSEIIQALEGIGASIGISFARDQAIKELEINERRIKLAQSSAGIGSWDWDITTGELIWSDEIEPMFGFGHGKFKGTYEAFLNTIHPEDRDFVEKSVTESLEKNIKYEIEHRIIWPDNTIRWLLEKGDVIRDKKNKPIRMLGVVQDITRKKELEQELHQRKENLEKMVSERTKELENINSKLKEEIYERKKAEDYIKRTKEYLSNILNSASEIIFAFDMNNRISSWNRTAERTTGYKTIEVLNRSVNKLEVFDNPKQVMAMITDTCRKFSSMVGTIILRNKDNQKKIVSISTSPIEGANKECQGSVFIGRDITFDLELHGKLLPGSSYYIPDTQLRPTLDLFSNITMQGINGLFITRSSPAIIRSIQPPSKNINIYIFSEADFKEYNTIQDLTALKNTISQFCKSQTEPIILLDGIHYLLTTFSFDQFIESLYQINDTIAKHHAILLVRLDPATLVPHQQAIIQNELQLLPSRKIEDLALKDDEYEILQYIYQKNQSNAIVSYKKLTQAFKIAYVTAANRLEKLESSGLLITKREGKHRVIYITEKGKNIIHIRQKA